jgi:glucan phosphoethanolaminetransferase (alkaline phosphatase superfamily)
MHLMVWRTKWFLFFIYAFCSAAPFIPFFFGKTIIDGPKLAGMEMVGWITVWAFFKRPAYFHWLLLPAFLALPLEMYLSSFYGQSISVHHLGIIAETSPKESVEFLGSNMWWISGLAIAVLALWVCGAIAAFGYRELDWVDPSRWVALFLLMLGGGTWIYGQIYGVERRDADRIATASVVSSSMPGIGSLPKLPAWAAIPFELSSFSKTWPFGIFVKGYEFWKERSYLAELSLRSSGFTFGARKRTHGQDPQIMVIVIGESSRFDRWSLNGYKRETNPLLSKELNLVSLSDVITAVSATRLSVPVLVSRKPSRMSLQAGFSEKSFITAFKEAGFKTWWLSNQMSFGEFDTPISVFAKEADVTQFLNLGGFTNRSSYDDVLLTPLQGVLDDQASKKLIVIHTLGSHWNYSHRHPKEFERWKPSLSGVDSPAYTKVSMKEQINNSYDNSILYTDWFLSKVIESLKVSGKPASMMYVADHGQSLYDGTCKLAFHGHNTQHDFHVPALVWYSDSYKSLHPEKVDQLVRNKDARLATENVFHALLDMADIQYPGEQLEWSFFNTKFKTHKRYVDSYGWSDYDNAVFKGDCREVIDKGQPVRQAK